MNKKKFLKVKIKNLADEARTIRHEERTFKFKRVKTRLPSGELKVEYKRVPIVEKHRPTFNGLYKHRVNVVRPAARNALIAYAFLRNRPYSTVKPKDEGLVDAYEVKRLVKKYGPVPDHLTDMMPEVIELLTCLKHWYEGKPVKV